MKSLAGIRQSDHLLILPVRSRLIASAQKNFFERDWSLAWTNFLLQEVGPHTFVFLERFEFEKLESYRYVYLPSSLAGKLEARHRALFESYVQSGGTLIVEGPTANSLKCSGIRLSSENQALRSMTSVPAQSTPHLLAESLLQMPFRTQGWKIDSRDTDLEVILEMDETPVFFKRSFGRGTVFTLAFDFGILLVGLQQGIPVNGAYRLQKLFGTQHRVVEPEDLVLKASLLDNPIPWADLFERFLFKTITQDEPTPRWWYFPSLYTGAVISTHDDESIGADLRLMAMCEKEKSEGIRGTLFVISDANLSERWSNHRALRHFSEEGTEIGLHWNRFQKPGFKFRSRKFGMHEEPLAEQLGYLQKEMGQPIQMNRTHYLALGTFYDEHFKSLAAEGVFFDSTYGPNQGGRGYLFGSGYPYYGLTWGGSLSGVLELPFLTQEIWGGADLDFHKRLIRESDENFHQVVTMNFHPHYTLLQEEGSATWLGTLRFAKERGQWLPTLGEFFQFFKKRSKSSLQSRYVEGALEVWVDSSLEDGALSFPDQNSEKKRFLGAEVDGSRIDPRKVINGWFEEWLVPLPAGSHRLKVHYGE